MLESRRGIAKPAQIADSRTRRRRTIDGRPHRTSAGILVPLAISLAVVASLIFVNSSAVGPVFDVIGVVIAAFSLLVLLPVVRNWWRMLDMSREARKLTTGVALLVALGAGVQFVVGLGGGQSFALSALGRFIVLPAAYLLFAMLLLTSRRPNRARTFGASGAVSMLLVATLVSLAASIALGGADIRFGAVAQGTALLCGFGLVYFAAAWRDYSDQAVRAIVVILAIGGGIAAVLGRQFAPFSTLLVPSGFALVAVAAQSKHKILVTSAGVILVLAAGFTYIFGINSPSFAKLAQFGVCALLALALLPGTLLRGLSLWGAGATALTLMAASGYLGELFQGASDGDVTLAQRSYEAAAVSEALAQSDARWLFGLGPGGIVDLSGSPDASTLSNSGRDLGAVDDVHLLHMWLLFKVGLLGLAAVILVLIAVFRAVFRVVGQLPARRPELALLFFVAAGIADALPAASLLFSNLVIPLGLGVVVARLTSTPNTTVVEGRRETAGEGRSSGVDSSHRRRYSPVVSRVGGAHPYRRREQSTGGKH